ncbi:hypothetical protein GQ53DRAFT_307872 [Thozetella sp. PMI_491]|nr:hypothetical protein GQ53DRAFT_307872 [Thozetella sp. PMI_491]
MKPVVGIHAIQQTTAIPTSLAPPAEVRAFLPPPFAEELHRRRTVLTSLPDLSNILVWLDCSSHISWMVKYRCSSPMLACPLLSLFYIPSGILAPHASTRVVQIALSIQVSSSTPSLGSEPR